MEDHFKIIKITILIIVINKIIMRIKTNNYKKLL